MSDLSIIPNDGYTLDAYVKAEPGIHGEHRIKFRPLLHEERYSYGEALGKKSPREASQFMCSVLAKHLKGWDVKNVNGDELPVVAESVRILRPDLLEKFYAIVSGRAAGDADPNVPLPASDLDNEAQALLEGRAVGNVREENDLKN